MSEQILSEQVAPPMKHPRLKPLDARLPARGQTVRGIPIAGQINQTNTARTTIRRTLAGFPSPPAPTRQSPKKKPSEQPAAICRF